MSNPKLSMEQVFACWAPFAIGTRTEIAVNGDWTELPDSDQALLVLGMQTGHGRSTPLVWKTVTRSQLKERRSEHEDELLMLFATLVPEGVRVTVVADRGFGDSALFGFLQEELGFEYLIRLRGVVLVESETGEQCKAKEWLGPSGRLRTLRQARLTAQRVAVPGALWALVCARSQGCGTAGAWPAAAAS